MISVFIQDRAHASEFKVQNTNGYLASLEKINLFIGENNSGKSRLIRSLLKQKWTENRFRTIEDETIPILNKHYNKTSKSEIINIFRNLLIDYKFEGEKTVSKILSKLENSNKESEIFQYYLEAALVLSSAKPEHYSSRDANPKMEREKEGVVNKMRNFGTSMIQTISSHVSADKPNKESLYIPVLRGLRPIHMVSESKFDSSDDYTSRTMQDYFAQGNRNSNVIKDRIFSGLTLYEEITKLLLGTVEQRKKIAAFELFLSEQIFDGQEITLIPKYKDDVLHVKIGQSEQRPVYNLGDGIQTIISILFPVFMREDKQTLVFLEEPEMHLHPRFQRLLIDAFMKIENHQFFISTHSSVFMNTENACIYKVSNEGDQVSLDLISLNSDRRTLLSSLGYKASDILLSNYVLWVEGPSDKVYFEYWISKLSGGGLVLGKHYDMMMYHGSFERHIDLNAFSSISQHYGIYIDSDRVSDKDLPKQLKEDIKMGVEEMEQYCWVSQKRAIENYIPLSDFITAVRKAHRINDDYYVGISSGDYVDRGKVVDVTRPKAYSSRIKIPDDIWTAIKANGDGTTKGIDSRNLRKAIESAITHTDNNKFGINKIQVAQEVVKLNPAVEDSELIERIQALILAIKRANQMESLRG